jgi:hypothetical protein
LTYWLPFCLTQPRKTEQTHALAAFILRQPVLWGLVVSANFFALLHQGVIDSWLLRRYCAGHAIEFIEMTVFFVGLSALVIRFVGVMGQFPSLRCLFFFDVPAGGQHVSECDQLLDQLAEHPQFQNTYLVRR